MAHVWRGVMHEYADRLGVTAESTVVSLGEGGTPLVPAPALSRRTGAQVWVKFEGMNPTGSFKDRGMTVALSRAVEHGAKAVDGERTEPVGGVHAPRFGAARREAGAWSVTVRVRHVLHYGPGVAGDATNCGPGLPRYASRGPRPCPHL